MRDDPRSHPEHRRFRQRRLFARDVEASVEIDAPRATVWAALVDFEAYPRWNPFTPRVSTDLEVGSPVHLGVDMPGRAYSDRVEWVNLVEPGRTICWGMMIGHPALLVANRWQELEELGPARTRYATVDRFSGLLVPMMMALYGEPMRRGFESVGAGLKRWVEAGTAGRHEAAPAPPAARSAGVAKAADGAGA